MNRDEVIRLAREVGLGEITTVVWSDFLERFAALVAAAEREACAAICDNAEKRSWLTFFQGERAHGFGAADCAAAIRARGEK